MARSSWFDFPDECLAFALPNEDQPERGNSSAVARPLDLFDHEARLRPVDHPGALADPEQTHRKREKADNQKQLSHGVILFRVDGVSRPMSPECRARSFAARAG